MKPSLLDVNLLLALAWSTHTHHAVAMKWLARRRAQGLRTCPVVQLGFVRISSNAKLHARAVNVRSAVELLERMTLLPEHEFWPDDLAVSAGSITHRVFGHRQVMDAYLLGLAGHRGGRVATLDHGLWELSGRDNSLVDFVSPTDQS